MTTAASASASPLLSTPAYFRWPVERWQATASFWMRDTALRDQVAVAKRQLEVDGFAVVPDIYSPEECWCFRNDFWASLNAISNGRFPPYEPTSPEMIRDARVHKATKAEFRVSKDWVANRHGILEDGAFAHLPLCYAVRTNPRIAAIFALLYGDRNEDGSEMVVACDRLNYQLPPEWLPNARAEPKTSQRPRYTDSLGREHPVFSTATEGTWLHVDQSREYTDFRCYQGLVQFTSTEHDGDASLEVVPKSHLDFPRLGDLLGIAKFPKPKENWYMFSHKDKSETSYFREGSGRAAHFISVRAPAGSLLLWDSRTIHQGGRIRSALRTRPEPRFVVYVCMQPGHIDLHKEVEKKVKMVEKRQATAHWPLATKAFGPPRIMGKDPEGDERATYNFEAALFPVGEVKQWPVLMHLLGVRQLKRLAISARRLELVPRDDGEKEEEEEMVIVE